MMGNYLVKKISIYIRCIFLLFLILLIISPDLNSNGLKNFDLLLFKEIVKENSRILSIDADIEQNIQTHGAEPEIFKGRYRADKKGRFRIDYHKPDKQVVINDGNRLYWYYVNEKLLYEIKGGNGVAPKNDPMGEFSGSVEKRFEVKYLGSSFYGLLNVTDMFRLFNKDKGVSIYLWIDKNKNVILKKALIDKSNREILKEIYGNYKKVNNIYFPMMMKVFVRTEKGVTRNFTYYKNVFLNKKINSNIFNYRFPEDVKRVGLNKQIH